MIYFIIYMYLKVKENPAFTMSTDISKAELKSVIDDDTNLQPVLMDDALLYGNLNIYLL